MVTLALVGAGSWGRNYLAAAKSLHDVEIKYVVTEHDHAETEFSGIQILTDISEVPADIDGAIIATPAQTHYALAKHFIKRNCSVLIEKPFALSVAEARDLKRISADRTAKVLVGHVQLYNPAYRVAKSLALSLGELKKVWFRGVVSPKREDVSVLWDWGPHPASLFLDLIDAPITAVSAVGNNERVTFVLTYPNMTAQAEIGWEGAGKRRDMIIEGTRGTITLDDTKLENKIAHALLGQSTSFPHYGPTPPLTVELEEFVRVIRGEQEAYSGIEMGVRVTEVLAQVEKELERSA